MKKQYTKLKIGKTIANVFIAGLVSGDLALGTMQGIKEVNADCINNLETRVVNVQEAPKSKKKIIVLDPGHGRNNRKQGVYDPGAITGNIYEEKVVLNQANKVKELLENKGYEVILTRNDVNGINYKQRAKFAKDNNADILVSLHCDGSENESAHGQWTWYKEDNSKELARCIQEQLVNEIAKTNKDYAKDRGIRTANYAIFKTDIPSVLVESGFLTNKTDIKYLIDDINDVELGIAKGIENYFGKD